MLFRSKRKVGGISSIRFLDTNGIYGTDGEYLLNILKDVNTFMSELKKMLDK